MKIFYGIFVSLLLTTFGVTTWALASENESANITNTDFTSEEKDSSEIESKLEPRNDLDDLSDDVLRKFFDFTSIDADDSEENGSESAQDSIARTKAHSKYYSHRPAYYDTKNRYYRKKTPMVPYQGYRTSFHRPQPYFSKGQVTPGSHYKYGTHKSIGDKLFDESKLYSNASQTIVGPYQVSVVDANSPLLSSLGLKRHHLEKLSGSSIPVATRSPIDLTVSDSIPSASYAEYPGHSYNNHGPHHNPPPHYDSRNDHSNGHHPPPQGSIPPPNYHHPGQQDHHHQHPPPPSHPHPHPHSHNSPPNDSPQRSYLPPHQPYKDHHSSSSPMHDHKYHYNPPSKTQYSSVRYPSDWRPSGSSALYDNDPIRDSQKDNPNYNRGAWQQPAAVYPPHPPPLSQSPSYPDSYSRPSSSTSYKPSSSYSKPDSSSYQKPTYSSTSKTPERAGSTSHDSYHPHRSGPPSKPSITVRFKAKAPHAGISIPLNFNPLDVVKKLAMPLSALNPLANKKVTIGITIENKQQDHSETHYPHGHY